MSRKNAGKSRPKSASGAPPLPSTQNWLPRTKAAKTLSQSFLQQCAASEELVLLRSRQEKKFNIDNYDSGLGIEDVVREELARIMPRRYSIKAGVVSDRKGATAGDFDLVVFNADWFSAIKVAPSSSSRSLHLPIDGVYAVFEIKQRLTWASFDDAMRKLVSAHRLHRPRTNVYRQTENRDGVACHHGLCNPLFSVVLATEIEPGLSIEHFANRFFDINKTLTRLEMVHALCVLGEGTVTWGYHAENGGINPTLFMNDDLYLPIVPTLRKADQHGSPFYHLVSSLLRHCYHSILAPEDHWAAYGPDSFRTLAPKDSNFEISPDPEWLKKLKEPCDHDRLNPKDGLSSVWHPEEPMP